MSETWILLVVILPFVALLVGLAIEAGTRPDLDRLHRSGWILLLVALPVVGLAAYVLTRPPGRGFRGRAHAGTDPDTARAETIVLLAERRQRGEISDEEFRIEVGAVASVG